MKIAWDAQLLMDPEKTGIGFMAQNIIQSFAGNPQIQGTLNVFTMRKRRRHPEQLQRILDYAKLGYDIHACGWFHDVAYKMIWNFLPLPYHWFFGKEADITHFFNYYVPPGVHGKVITTVCDMVCEAYPETMNRKTRTMLKMSLEKSCKRADCIVTISEFSKQEIMRYMHIPEQKIEVVPCGVDMETYHPNWDEAAIQRAKAAYRIGSPYFLYLGTLEPRKNIERLIEAYAQFKGKHPQAPKLVLAGRKGWLYDSIFERVQQCQIEADVIFTGYVKSQDVAPLICGALAFVFPSLYEGFGLPPLESMACGTPVIASDVASIPEVVGDAGLLVDPLQPAQLCDAMQRVWLDEALRAELRQKGLARAQTFTWKAQAERMLDVYARVYAKE